MNQNNNLIGQKFGRLTVINTAPDYVEPRGRHNRMWLCKCECGNLKAIRETSLINKETLSCGCYNKEQIRKSNKLRKKSNTYDLSREYGVGYTSNTNKEFYFDLEDYEKIKDYYWYETQYGYLASSCVKEGKKQQISLHRLIMNVNNSKDVVDHFNHNKLDNRKENLRIVTTEQNNWNKTLQTNNQSGITGVRWKEDDQVWVAYIKRVHLGSFKDYESAVKARLKAEKEYFGKYRLNNSYLSVEE